MNAELHTLTGAYAVDALPEDERRFFEQHLATCDACRLEVAEFQAAAARLGAALSDPPPPQLRASVLDAIDRTRQESPSARTDASSRRGSSRLGWTRPLAAAAAAAALVALIGLGTVVVDLNDRLDEMEGTATQITDVLAAPDAATVPFEGADGDEAGSASMVMAASRGEGVFVASQMADPPPDRTYELWVIDGDEAAPAGTFEPDETGRATRALTGDMADASAIAVTVEPAGGSWQPTPDPVMIAEL